jgi:hypothetical protein
MLKIARRMRCGGSSSRSFKIRQELPYLRRKRDLTVVYLHQALTGKEREGMQV